MKVVDLFIGVLALLLGFFVGRAFRQFVVMPLAPPDADAGFAFLAGLIQWVVWLAFAWLVARVLRSTIRKTRK